MIRRSPKLGPRAGVTLLEVLVTFAVLLVALGAYSSMVASSARVRSIHRENSLATNAAKVVLEEMRNEPFDLVYALYNADPDDDPLGPGTAPGNRFAVDGLSPMVEGELQGEVVLPVLEVAGAGPPSWELREDADDPALGMPRDLNGDSIVDDEDHAGDYLLLPVRVRIVWRGVHGQRTVETFCMLTDYLGVR